MLTFILFSPHTLVRYPSRPYKCLISFKRFGYSCDGIYSIWELLRREICDKDLKLQIPLNLKIYHRFNNEIIFEFPRTKNLIKTLSLGFPFHITLGTVPESNQTV